MPRYRWAVLAAGTLAQASFSTVAFAVAVLAPALRERYELSLAEIGIVLAAEWIGLTFALLPWGFAVDRFGERWTLAGGLAVCSACLAGAAFAPSFGSLVVLLALGGVAGASVQTGSGRAVMRWFAPSQRGLALGVRQTAVPVGGAVAALVLPLLGGPRAGFLFLAGFVLAGALVGAFVLTADGADHVEVDDVETSLRDRLLWLVCGASGLYVIAQVATMSFLVLFLVDAHGFRTSSAAAVLAASQVLAAALRIGTGSWSDRIGSRTLPLRLVGLAIAASLLLVAALAEQAGWLLVPVLVAATGLSMAWNGLSFTLAAELGGRRAGAAIGLQQTVLAGVGVVVPVVFAATVSRTSWQAAFAVFALPPLAGWWLLRPLRRLEAPAAEPPAPGQEPVGLEAPAAEPPASRPGAPGGR